ncbi:MAG: hypothetical protein JWM25_37 [Thermoleophilia bacterium]|nr:hypothetical protein [Thermoleophilia bacterium]
MMLLCACAGLQLLGGAALAVVPTPVDCTGANVWQPDEELEPRWSEPGNWSAGHVPTASETVCVGEEAMHVDVDVAAAAIRADSGISLAAGLTITTGALQTPILHSPDGSLTVELVGAAPTIDVTTFEVTGALHLSAGSAPTGQLGDVRVSGTVTLDYEGELAANEVVAGQLELPGAANLVVSSVDLQHSLIGTDAVVDAQAVVVGRAVSVTPAVVSADINAEYSFTTYRDAVVTSWVRAWSIVSARESATLELRGAHVTTGPGADDVWVQGNTTWTQGATLDATTVMTSDGTTVVRDCRWNVESIDTEAATLRVEDPACIDPIAGTTLPIRSAQGSNTTIGLVIATSAPFAAGGILQLQGTTRVAGGSTFTLTATKLAVDELSSVFGAVSAVDVTLGVLGGISGSLELPWHGVVRVSSTYSTLAVPTTGLAGELVFDATYMGAGPIGAGHSAVTLLGPSAAPARWRVEGTTLAPGVAWSLDPRTGSEYQGLVLSTVAVAASPTPQPPAPIPDPIPLPDRPTFALPTITWQLDSRGRPVVVVPTPVLRSGERSAVEFGAAWTRAADSTVPLVAGRRTCVRVVASNVTGSTTSTPRCTTAPWDDTSLRARGFATTKASWAYRGTAAAARRAGATLVTPRISGRTLTIAATTCPTCGSIRIVRAGTVVATRSLVARRTTNRALVTVKLPKGAAPITIRTASARLVRIDAIVAQ